MEKVKPNEGFKMATALLARVIARKIEKTYYMTATDIEIGAPDKLNMTWFELDGVAKLDATLVHVKGYIDSLGDVVITQLSDGMFAEL